MILITWCSFGTPPQAPPVAARPRAPRQGQAPAPLLGRRCRPRDSWEGCWRVGAGATVRRRKFFGIVRQASEQGRRRSANGGLRHTRAGHVDRQYSSGFLPVRFGTNRTGPAPSSASVVIHGPTRTTPAPTPHPSAPLPILPVRPIRPVGADRAGQAPARPGLYSVPVRTPLRLFRRRFSGQNRPGFADMNPDIDPVFFGFRYSLLSRGIL